MKKILLLSLPLLMAGCAGSGVPTGETHASELRAPAYPLVTIDPYTSAWSMTDNLYDGPVRHWTGSEFPLIGALKVDGVVYRLMGTEDQEFLPVVPTSLQGDWSGRYTTERPAGNWMKPGYADASWTAAPGAFGTPNESSARTRWTTRDIWVRRTATLDEDLRGKTVYLEFSNDDDAVFYVNGVEVYNTGSICNRNRRVALPEEAVRTLGKGEVLLAAHCTNPQGFGIIDFGLIVPKEQRACLTQTAEQRSVDVQATQTHYAFTCGGVDLEISFSAPLFLDDLDLVSRPVNYLTYRAVSNDGQPHEMELYLEAGPAWALDQPYQACVSECTEQEGLVCLRSGSREQKILAKCGDDLRIDWGYFYLAAERENTLGMVGTSEALRNRFVDGTAEGVGTTGEGGAARMALIRTLGTSDKAAGKVLLAYDDIYSIQYFGENLRPYWNRDGKQTILGQLTAANRDYASLIKRCYAFDRELMEEAAAAGGQHYAELCALAYRQAIAAHKLVLSPEGDLLWLSKENNSNGSIGTVDVTYPSAPLFLRYNVELAKGLMNHIYYFSESGRWTKPFAAHDVGTYPLANGQTYGGDMPVEESGNMLSLTAAVCMMEGSAAYAEKHWEVLTTWVNYLVEKGLDPENQLCTDDFAGHFAHNANLSIKAILGIASYGRMAAMLGKEDVAEQYTAKARELAQEWVRMADDGDHYRLTFDKTGTWSQKYNLVWDKLLGLDIFPAEVAGREIAYYLTKQNRYGLPLDSRETYTKSDWIVWTATLADDRATFERFIDPLYAFMNETVDRVPMSDWYYTDRPNYRGFKARSVVGGYFIKMLEPHIEK